MDAAINSDKGTPDGHCLWQREVCCCSGGCDGPYFFGWNIMDLWQRWHEWRDHQHHLREWPVHCYGGRWNAPQFLGWRRLDGTLCRRDDIYPRSVLEWEFCCDQRGCPVGL